MSRKNEQTGSSNHANMRDPDTLQSQAAGHDSNERTRRQTMGPPQRRERGGSAPDEPYERDVREPTNRSALGDQSTKR